VRVFWPLDDAWYGGVCRGYDAETKRHAVLYHDGVEEFLDFDEEKAVVVTEARGDGDGDGDDRAGGVGLDIVSTSNALPVRLPITCGARGVGWLMPNPRRGREEVRFHDETANATIALSASAFAARFDDEATGDETKGKSLQSKRWRRGCRFDPNRAGFHWKARGGERAISVGAFLQQQGAAWGEAIVGRPLTLRPEGYAYAESTLASAERTADEAARRSVTESATEALTREPEPSEPRDAAIATNATSPVPADATEDARDPLGSAPTERRDGGLDDGDGSGSDPADEPGRTDWVTVSVLAYSDASGEHQVLYPDGKREWLALVMQETGGNA
jgi:hypothetical protein